MVVDQKQYGQVLNTPCLINRAEMKRSHGTKYAGNLLSTAD